LSRERSSAGRGRSTRFATGYSAFVVQSNCLPPGLWLTHAGVTPLGIWLRFSSALTSEPAMPDEPRLREQARAAIQSGKLPSRAPDRTWGGPGVGAACAVCGLPITREQLEFEIQFARDGDNPGLDKFHVHIRCFAAWEFERNKP
jgi:hypothetical protein